MKKHLLLLPALLCGMAVQASDTWTLTKTNAVYQVDTLYHATVGPGTTQTSLSLKGAYTMRVYFLTVDLNDENVKLTALKAGDGPSGLATVPDLAAAHDVEGKVSHFAGVNADFFSMSSPYYTNGLCISDGYYYSTQNAVPWNHWAITADNTAMTVKEINVPTPRVKFPNGTVYNAYKNKNPRSTNELVIYLPDYGTNTGQNKWGSEAVIEPVDGVLFFNSLSRQWRVVGAPTAANTTAGRDIPEGKAVLSGNGLAANLVAALKDGDLIDIDLLVKVNGQEMAVSQVTGCNNILLDAGTHIDISSSNAPRTAVGHSADGKKVVMMAVDGRQEGFSDGAYYRMMAALMEKAGCTDAVELDGGGSTTMYVKSRGGVVNSPSEGSLRKIAVGLYATTTVSADAEDYRSIARIEVEQKNIHIDKGETFTPRVYGYNRYGVLIDTDVADYTLSAPASLGYVSSDQKSVTATGEGWQPLTVKYGQLSITVPVKLPGEAGVEGVLADDQVYPEVYYNLQGVRVDNPSGGVYIVRTGDKAEKRVIR